VVPETRVVKEWDLQVESLLLPGWDRRTTAILERPIDAAGVTGAPVEPFAEVTIDTPTRVVVNAGAGESGGHLVLLDSYSADWQVVVDGQPAEMTRANGLFRGVHLAPGRHEVTFVYRPRAFRLGAATSAAGLLIAFGLLAVPRRRPSQLP
jgi:hypothetical protein